MSTLFRNSNRGRRSFMKLCMGAVTAGHLRHSLASSTGTARTYHRAVLHGANGLPLKAGDLSIGRSYVFHYPYVSTPCFLIDIGEPMEIASNLEDENGQVYTWTGGVGHGKSIVAYSAICAHKMTHPARSVSFINYRHEAIRYRDAHQQQASGDKLIYCCSEQSVYDVRRGASVLGGPAPQPLTSIVLEYDTGTDQLTAIATQGGEMYDKYFDKFGARLQLEYRTTGIRELVSDSTGVMPLEEFSEKRVSC